MPLGASSLSFKVLKIKLLLYKGKEESLVDQRSTIANIRRKRRRRIRKR